MLVLDSVLLYLQPVNRCSRFLRRCAGSQWNSTAFQNVKVSLKATRISHFYNTKVEFLEFLLYSFVSSCQLKYFYTKSHINWHFVFMPMYHKFPGMWLWIQSSNSSWGHDCIWKETSSHSKPTVRVQCPWGIQCDITNAVQLYSAVLFALLISATDMAACETLSPLLYPECFKTKTKTKPTPNHTKLLTYKNIPLTITQLSSPPIWLHFTGPHVSLQQLVGYLYLFTSFSLYSL